jgi:hypothetical protein
MKEIFSSVIRKKVTKLISDIGLDISEIVIKLPLGIETFDTIELINNTIILHRFEANLDYIFPFDHLEDEDKLEVYKLLFIYL